MKTRTKALLLLQRTGPYHHARLSALAQAGALDLVVAEYRANESVYIWDSVASDQEYMGIRLGSGSELPRVLEDLSPDVLVLVGYSDPEIHGAVRWSLMHSVPLVVCSDSTFEDDKRVWVKETGKRALLGAFDAALVAGKRSQDYLGHLGLPAQRCFQPWDVVHNKHFQDGAASAQENAAEERLRRGLPKAFFLSVGRFVQKKNFAGLIKAYRTYVTMTGNDSWDLVLAGSGALENDLRRQTEAEGIRDRVLFVGPVGYEDLPYLYGLAEAFIMPSASEQWGLVVNEAMAASLPVLVSSRCGCTPELVHEGKNGFTFDPEDVQGLAALLLKLQGTDPGRRREMGRWSQEIVARYSPEAFASGLAAAVQCALENKWRRKNLSTRLIVRLLAELTPCV